MCVSSPKESREHPFPWTGRRMGAAIVASSSSLESLAATAKTTLCASPAASHGYACSRTRTNVSTSRYDVGGGALVVSQFTLITDSRSQKGTRPDFSRAARKESPSHYTNTSSRRYAISECPCRQESLERECRSRSSTTGR